MKFIDSHIHIEQLSSDCLETMAISGLEKAISPMARPAVILGKGKDVLAAEDIVQYWDYCAWYRKRVREVFFFTVYYAFSLGSNTKIKGYKELVKLLPEYLKKEGVVALGEIGLDPHRWESSGILTLDESKNVTREQFQIAKDMDIPVIVHTPLHRLPKDYVKGSILPDDCPPWPFKKHFAKETLKLANEVGVKHERMLVDHADEELVEYVLNETNAYVGISGANVKRNIPPHIAAQIVERTVKRFGSKRIIIDSDSIGHLFMEPLWMAKTIRELKRLDMKEDDIANVVFNNPLKIYPALRLTDTNE